jgi:hypothetical protein
MAKGQRRSNREKRKPKAEKKKAPAGAVSPFSSVVAQQKADPGRFGRKGR